MPFKYAEFMTQLMAPKPYPAQAVFDPPKLTPLRKPIDHSRRGEVLLGHENEFALRCNC
jgi:hypothetical protein